MDHEMDHEFQTRELAAVYEAQGYYQDALDIYVSLDRKHQSKDPDILAACTRIKNFLEKQKTSTDETGRPVRLIEQWLTLLIMENKKIKIGKMAAKFDPVSQTKK
ncbi:MAG: hypothetical protein K9K21_02280 [Desulfotignum sp.]|nr:hypothetical protein [Desulfotignum sp.]MCF8112660.1 hypothetical protein [Desulfotignum sp.]MCF8126421.1 hypothetical protein [Desulfotignum sp.]